MALQHSDAMASSEAAPIMSRAQSIIPATGLSSSALTPASASAGQPPRAGMQHSALQESEEAWSLVARSLMLAVMVSQPPATAANTLLGVFRPMVDGWAATRVEGKRWKEKAELSIHEHHKHRTELAQKHNTLQAEVERLQQSLADSQSKLHEVKPQQSALVAKVSSLENMLTTAQAQARDSKETHVQEMQESKKQVEAKAKSAQEVRMMYGKLQQERENMTKLHTMDVIKLNEKMKEMEAGKANLEERLKSTVARSTSIEEAVSQKGQEVTNLEAQVTELTARIDTLQRQRLSYQRTPTRRWL